MTIKKLTYIGFALLTGFFSACSDDITTPNTLSGDGTKTPLGVTALLDAGGSSTRAANKEFADEEELLAYVRHVKWDGNTATPRTQTYTADFNTLVTFTATGNTAYTGDDVKPIGLGGEVVVATKTGSVTNQATTLTASPVLYWDDFSANSAYDGQDASTNLRDNGHYLQSYYGYCYNGSPAFGESGTHITSALVENTGVLGWQVATDQTAADKSAFKTSDLLWSAEQTPIEYAHVDVEGKKNHGTLVLPYTHAMSKVTVNITLHESFGNDGAIFKDVETTLHEMFTRCTCTAPTYNLSAKGTSEGVDKTTNIIMWNKENANTNKVKTCTFEAIVVPSILSVVNNFATITGLDGNKYDIPITAAMLQKASEHDGKGWGDQLTETTEHINDGTAQAPPRTRATIDQGKGYEMKSGVNYVLNVNISKQQITVSATIKDWVDVNANGVGLVQFTSDVNGKGDIANELKTGGFDVYKNSVNTSFTDKTTTLDWNYSKWEYDPVIYWAGQGDAAYFRALAPKSSNTSMNQGTDILWGYACDDDANNGSKVGTDAEVKITPRTGDVPLHFLHAMGKISVQLTTKKGTPSDATSSAVDLTGAKIEITNLAKGGTLELVKGMITPSAITSGTAIDGTVTTTNTNETTTVGTTTIANLPVIPQTIGDEAIMKVTLSDGTVYKLQLNKCYVNDGDDDDTNNVLIGAWVRNKHYNYIIHIEKEAITFRALIKDWEETSGGGNATLEWD